MSSRIVILGAGTGGTLAANRLHRRLGDRAEIVVIDHDDHHVYQPGLLFVPFGMAKPEDIVRPRHAQLHEGIDYRGDEVVRVRLADNAVELGSGQTLDHDVLVVATGTELQPDETEGLTGRGWHENLFTFYSLGDAAALREALADFKRGRLVVNTIDMPIKCPVAPLEFCFLADWYLRARGVRDAVELVYATPLDGAFTKPVASVHLNGLLAAKGIRMETEFATGEVDGARAS